MFNWLIDWLMDWLTDWLISYSHVELNRCLNASSNSDTAGRVNKGSNGHGASNLPMAPPKERGCLLRVRGRSGHGWRSMHTNPDFRTGKTEAEYLPHGLPPQLALVECRLYEWIRSCDERSVGCAFQRWFTVREFLTISHYYATLHSFLPVFKVEFNQIQTRIFLFRWNINSNLC